MKLLRVDVTPTTPEDKDLPAFDNTKLTAVNTCPLWGIVRYTLDKTMASGTGRAMALEAGGAAHEVFAAHRLYSFLEYAHEFYNLHPDEVVRIFEHHGKRLFGETRFNEACDMLLDIPDEDFRTRCIRFSLTTLYNSGFYDDPSDKRRTTTNIEEMCIAYMDRHDWSKALPVYIPDNTGGFLGIEIMVDVTLTIEYVEDDVSPVKTMRVRFIGKADGIHYSDNTKSVMRVHENKTASRLGDAWELSWETNHQPTGYMLALSAMLETDVSQAIILGSCLPMPVSYNIGGLSRVVIKRKAWQFQEWLEWFVHTVQLHDQYAHDPAIAPQYTHSCNRYFRSCMFIPICATEPEERRAAIDDMRVERWDPLAGEKEAGD